MNKAIIVGRITKDVEVKNTASQKSYATFTVAVDRRFKDSNGNRQTDFINCVAWGSQAGFVSHYFQKGSYIGVVGSIQTRSYDDNNGVKRFVTEIVADEVHFVGGKAESQNQAAEPVQDYTSLPFPL